MSANPSAASDRRTILAALIASVPAFASFPAVTAEAEAIAADGPGWFSAFGLRMKVEVDTASTGGSLSVTRVISPPGGGPPAHIHTREDEVFVILRGHYRFWQKDMPTIGAPAGSIVHLHKNMIHQYRNIADAQGEHLLMCLPGGLEGLFVEIAKQGLLVPRDLAGIIEISGKYGVEYKPPLAP